jgi:aminoglycoside 3-N-acetyltransferase
MTTISIERDAVRHLMKAADVPRDGVLVVQSAFKGLSRAGFRAESFIDSLLKGLSTGTLLMPAMSWRNVSPAQPIWDERGTPSHVGVLAEAFRTQYASHRSIHPTHSASAIGPAAVALLADHYRRDTPCPVSSPWGRLAEYDAHILLLGVGFESCTALHHPEEVIAPDIYLRPAAEAETYTCIAQDGTRFTVPLRRHLRLNRTFPQYGPRLAAKGQLYSGALPGTPWFLVRARHLMDDAFQNLNARPDAHFSADSPK